MSFIDFACVFVRASGDRLLAAERLACGFPHLFGSALGEVDLAYRTSSKTLVVVVRFLADAFDERARARLTFWSARAGGRASPLGGMAEGERKAFDAHLELCELKLLGLKPAELFDRTARLFTDVGAPAARRRNPLDRPMLALDLGGAGLEGVSYQADQRELFIAAPMAPPAGDEVLVVFRLPGADKPVGVKTRVTSVRTTAAAEPGLPAGFGLAIPAGAAAVHEGLVARAPTASGVRYAPRFNVKAPVKVLVPSPASPETTAPPPPPAPAWLAAPVAAPAAAAPAAAPAAAAARAVIEYATEQELEADFIENLSQGGAFIRSSRPQPVGATLALDFRLPNGAELRAQAVVAFANANGMGVRFTLDPESEAALQAAIAHISARARRALVVDDDALVRRMLADALADRGFEVVTASDGQDGLRVLSEELLALDLLVTDVVMPNMDGEAFVKTIRRAGGEADLAIVVVTGKMEPGLEPRLEAAGADAVLDKALGPELVAQAADAVLERRRLSRG
ncbi:MAG: response regulator [Anaeromyxobacter sp.]|nr:response regulator [Anaeromyxobacter sp.]